LSLAQEVAHPDLAYLAPQAAGNTWYPYRFLAPIQQNEPWLSSGLAVLAGIMAQVEAAGIPVHRIILGGFSQGACLAAEFVVRNPRRYGGLLIFSGGLIGPPGTSWHGSAYLDGMPAFLGCSDQDFHIPKERVEESAAVLQSMGATVDMRFYPGMGHTINEDELQQARLLVASAMAN
jgi:predicted esterase